MSLIRQLLHQNTPVPLLVPALRWQRFPWTSRVPGPRHVELKTTASAGVKGALAHLEGTELVVLCGGKKKVRLLV